MVEIPGGPEILEIHDAPFIFPYFPPNFPHFPYNYRALCKGAGIGLDSIRAAASNLFLYPYIGKVRKRLPGGMPRSGSPEALGSAALARRCRTATSGFPARVSPTVRSLDALLPPVARKKPVKNFDTFFQVFLFAA